MITLADNNAPRLFKFKSEPFGVTSLIISRSGKRQNSTRKNPPLNEWVSLSKKSGESWTFSHISGKKKEKVAE